MIYLTTNTANQTVFLSLDEARQYYATAFTHYLIIITHEENSTTGEEQTIEGKRTWFSDGDGGLVIMDEQNVAPILEANKAKSLGIRTISGASDNVKLRALELLTA